MGGHVLELNLNNFYWAALKSNFSPENQGVHLGDGVPIDLHRLYQIDSWWDQKKRSLKYGHDNSSG